jgi:CRP-like cAMP-binding protein
VAPYWRAGVQTRHVHYGQGEVLVELGTVLRSLFVIGAGVVSITAATTEGETEFLRIGPGDHYGEIGMLTEQPAAARLKALIPVTAYELAREDLAPVLEARPEVSQELSRALARRQAAGPRRRSHVTSVRRHDQYCRERRRPSHGRQLRGVE